MVNSEYHNLEFPASASAPDHRGNDRNIASWYVAYTKARHEKKIAEHLEMKHVEVFVPLIESARRWNTRKVVIQLPLFPGYVFVRISLKERLKVLEVPGLIQLVGTRGVPTALPDFEVEQLRTCLSLGLAPEPVPYLQAGDLARIVAGPLAGFTGIVLRHDKGTRFVLSINLIMRSVAVNVEASNLERIRAANIAAA